RPSKSVVCFSAHPHSPRSPLFPYTTLFRSMQSPLIKKFESGYLAGVKYANPKCEVLIGYAGVTGDAFKNPGKGEELALGQYDRGDRKSTRLNSSHVSISYAVFCLKKKITLYVILRCLIFINLLACFLGDAHLVLLLLHHIPDLFLSLLLTNLVELVHGFLDDAGSL